MRMHGWGRHPTIEADVLMPDSISVARQKVLQRNDSHMIARGLGRSYGDSSLAPVMLSTRHLDHFIAFDSQMGVIRCQAGVSLADILTICVPQGWFLPVTPGTKFVTVGGAIASDVHGKNHHKEGCFSEFIQELTLLLASGDILTCSRDENAELFYATCGGMGLTGIITTAVIKLLPIQSAFIKQTVFKANNLEEVLTAFDTNHHFRYSVAWIDCLAKDDALGRSLLMLGEHDERGGLYQKPSRLLRVPCTMPSWILNPLSIECFNYFYYNRSSPPIESIHYEPFFYPLDGIADWNRLYGKKGFIQYQFVLPKAAGFEGMRAIIKKIVASRKGAFLAVLKTLGVHNKNLLSFPLEGYTLAVDFKWENDLLVLLNELDAMVLDYGGRVYLTKDARMSEAIFKRSYPNWETFQEVRERYYALGRFVSLQSQRLGLDT